MKCEQIRIKFEKKITFLGRPPSYRFDIDVHRHIEQEFFVNKLYYLTLNKAF